MASNTWEDMWSNNGGLKPGQYFDATIALPGLTALLERHQSNNTGFNLLPNSNVLVPGCGRGYACIEFAKFGYHSTGIDIAPTAISSAQTYYDSLQQPNLSVQYQNGSFFELEENLYDVAYDYTFFCALPPEMRTTWASTYSKVIKEGGILITAIFPIRPGEEGGPPFAVSLELYQKTLRPAGFELVQDEEPEILANPLAHPDRGNGQTALAVWRNVGTTKESL